jgi:Heavy metal associated domain 2
MGPLQKHNLQADVPKAHVSHRVEGRARLRIPSRRGDQAFFERLKERTGELSQVKSTEVNARTGGVLIRHNGPLESITEECRQRGLFDLESVTAFEQPVVERVRDQLATLDAAVRGTSAGQVNMWAMVSLLFIGLAIIQLARGRILGPVTTLMWAAINAMALSLKAARAAVPEQFGPTRN